MSSRSTFFLALNAPLINLEAETAGAREALNRGRYDEAIGWLVSFEDTAADVSAAIRLCRGAKR